MVSDIALFMQTCQIVPDRRSSAAPLLPSTRELEQPSGWHQLGLQDVS
jgi:hypothetical protein